MGIGPMNGDLFTAEEQFNAGKFMQDVSQG